MYHRARRNFVFYVRKRRMKSTNLSLSKVIEGFMIACQSRRLSEHTIRDYRHTLGKFLSHTGDMNFSQITHAQISAFLSAQSVGNKTLLNYHIALSALWTWAIKQEYVEKHVVRLVEKPRPKKLVIEPFSEVEVRAILNSIVYSPDRNRALVLLLLDTGARASEVCGLTMSDIDLVKRHIKVRGKGDKERLIPFSQRTSSALFSHMATMSGDKLFPMSRHALAQYMRRLGKRAGVQDTHPHRFRHTMAIQYLRNGGDPYTLQDLLGHTTMEMVRNYIKIAQIDIDAAHKRASPVENWKL